MTIQARLDERYGRGRNGRRRLFAWITVGVLAVATTGALRATPTPEGGSETATAGAELTAETAAAGAVEAAETPAFPAAAWRRASTMERAYCPSGP